MKNSASFLIYADERIVAEDLLSVDADAHLQKMATRMFPSPAQLPLELVRAALKRGAASIALQVRRDRLIITDDGNGIGRGELDALARVFDVSQDAVEREKAIADIQRQARPGIGLLAIFFPGALRIAIENAGSTGKTTLCFAKGKVEWNNSCSLARGTRILIYRHRGQSEREKRVIRELCAAVQKDITLNGQPLEKKPLLTGTMASLAISLPDNGKNSTVAIPIRGDVCRIWLLDQGIPWQVTTEPADQGLVFEAALENIGPLTPQIHRILQAAAYRLYQWLAEHYASFPEKYQDRIEELLFKQARLFGDHRLLAAFSPFRLWHSLQRLNLDDVRRRAEKSILYAVPLDGKPGFFSPKNVEALRLTSMQKDFLINYLNLPLVTLGTHMISKNQPQAICFTWLREKIRLSAPLAHRQKKILPAGQLSPGENTLIREMEAYWRLQLASVQANAKRMPLTVVMVAERGLVPAYWVKTSRGSVLHLRRRHPWTRRAVQSLGKDRGNIDLVFAALAPGHFLTAVDL